MNLIGFGCIAVLLLELSLIIARNVLVRVGCSMWVGGVRVPAAWLGSVEEKGIRPMIREIKWSGRYTPPSSASRAVHAHACACIGLRGGKR